MSAGSRVVRRQLGVRLRRLRERARKRPDDIVEGGVASRATLYRIEAGQVPVRRPIIESLCRLYGADDATTDQLAGLAAGTQGDDWWVETYGAVVVPDWFGLYVGLEEAAASIRCWGPEIVHGLVQTEDYARAIISSEIGLSADIIKQRVRFRMDRQRKVLGRKPNVTLLLGAGALTLAVGSREVLAAQVRHLRDVARSGVVDVRVRPWSAGAHPIHGPFALLEFDDEQDPACAYVEYCMGARIEERQASLTQFEHHWGLLLSGSIPIEEWT
jgi:transcriptional regulator with XRE-family HTH domain